MFGHGRPTADHVSVTKVILRDYFVVKRDSIGMIQGIVAVL